MRAILATLFDPTGRRGPARLAWREGRIVEAHPQAEAPAHARGAGARDSRSSGTAREAGLLALPEEYVVLPGFVDAHTHLMGLGFERLRPDMTGAASKAEVLARLDEWLREHPGSDPVIGEGWDQSLWSDPTAPLRAEIDRVAPDRPVALRRVCGHVAVLNTRALESVGPDWSDLDRETGLALETLPLTLSRVWPPSAEQCDEAVRLGQEEAWLRGVTGIHEMGHATTYRAFGRAEAAGRLHLRVCHYFAVDLLEHLERLGLVPGQGSERLRVGGVKLFLDGSIGGRTAAVAAAYPGVSAATAQTGDGRGLLLFTDERLLATLRRACRAGFPPAMHAIGDRAIAQAISGVEALAKEGLQFPPPGPRVEHAEMLEAASIERGARAGILFSMQPNFTARWQGAGALYEQVLGEARARVLNPFREVAARGRLVFGSDTMPLDPLLGLRGAAGHPLPGQRLPLGEAVRHYTASPASAEPRPFGGGRLADGEPADFVVLRIPGGIQGTPFDSAGAAGLAPRPAPEGGTPFDPAARATVAATWVDGVVRYADAAFRRLLDGVAA